MRKNIIYCFVYNLIFYHFMLSASTDLPQVQSYHNQYFYSLDFALFINKKQNKGGESLPLARTTLLATPSSGGKIHLNHAPATPQNPQLNQKRRRNNHAEITCKIITTPLPILLWFSLKQKRSQEFYSCDLIAV